MNQVWMDVVIPGFCGLGMHLRLDGFRLVYCLIAVFMWTVSGIFSREYMAHYANRRRYYIFFWATFAATVGVFLSANLFTTFIFFEIMSFTSYVWVAFDERPASLRAAETYLAVAVIGGMVMLMGLFLLYDLFGTLEIDEISVLAEQLLGDPVPSQGGSVLPVYGDEGQWNVSRILTPREQLYTAGGLLLFGFGAKAGVFPLHIWLPKAHPEAPAPASALLSGILTKAGVFGIIVVSCGLFGADHGWGLLIAGLGLVTMFVGALLAVFSINLKKTLACSSISQIGFILTGIGMACLLRSIGEGNAPAVRGAFLHMVNHSLFKLVLFLCAGAVYMNLHELDLNAVRGFGHGKPVLAFSFLMGALGIGGIPLWSGYVSKTLIHESIVEYMEAVGGPWVWHLAEWVFLFTGGMTVAYMLKLFVALFVEENADRGKQERFDAMCSAVGRRMRRAEERTAVSAGRMLEMAAEVSTGRTLKMPAEVSTERTLEMPAEVSTEQTLKTVAAVSGSRTLEVISAKSESQTPEVTVAKSGSHTSEMSSAGSKSRVPEAAAAKRCSRTSEATAAKSDRRTPEMLGKKGKEQTSEMFVEDTVIHASEGAAGKSDTRPSGTSAPETESHAPSHVYMRPLTGAVLAAAAVILPLLGLTAHQSMGHIADLGQAFFHMTGEVHPVAYFSFTNLKGALISIVIGLLLYGIVIRGLLMEPDGAGGRRYVDRWPAWLDLENLIYRPILQTALPAIGGAVCGFLDRYLVPVTTALFLTVSTFVSRVLDSLADWVIRLARLTTHRQVRAVREQHDTDLAAHVIGEILDTWENFRRRLPWRRNRETAADAMRMVQTTTSRLVRGEERFRNNLRMIQESFSYGLMLVCLGLCVTLGYLLLGFLGR